MNSVIAAVLNSLWQAVAIAACVWAILKFAPRMSAATRHAVWWAVLLAVIALPAAHPLMQRNRPAKSSPVVRGPNVDPLPAGPRQFQGPVAPVEARPAGVIEIRSEKWREVLFALWAVVLLVQMARVLRSYWYVRGLKLRATPATPEAQRNFSAWLESCRVNRPARLLISNEIASPLAAGFIHPAVILPEAVIPQFREEELDHVLLHELAHLARRDDFTNLAARLVTALVALHPVAAWILRRIEKERELACDDWVVAHTGAARPYAASLARVFEICVARRRTLLASGMADHASHLGQRIEELLRRREFARRASRIQVVASALAVAGLALIAAGTPPWIVFARAASPAPQAPNAEPAPATSKQARPPAAAEEAPARPAVKVSRPAPAPAAAPAQAPPVQPPPGGFLASLVAAGYGDLSVDEIIGLKNNGLNGEFILGMRQSGWGKLPPRDLIRLWQNGVRPPYAEGMLDADVKDLTVEQLVDLRNNGVQPEYVRELHALGFGPFGTREIIELKNNGVQKELLRALKEAGFAKIRPNEIVEAQRAGLRESQFREAKELSSTLTLAQIIKLKHAGVLR